MKIFDRRSGYFYAIVHEDEGKGNRHEYMIPLDTQDFPAPKESPSERSK